jgi:GNAT superfamily N-acetyltransferase
VDIFDLFENKNRSYKNLIAKAMPVYEAMTKKSRSKRLPKMFRSCDDFVQWLLQYDPTYSTWGAPPRLEAKYFDWLLRAFVRNPWKHLTKDWRDRNTFETDFPKSHALSIALKDFEAGRYEQRDINAFKTIDELLALKPKEMAGKPFEMKLSWDENGRGCKADVFVNGKHAGNFIIDFTHKDEKKCSVHAFLKKEYQGKGLGYRIYGWLTAKLREKGYSFVPSDRLTDHAYALWKRREPQAVEGYERHPSREVKEGFLWLSPYWLEREAKIKAERQRATTDFYNHEEEMARAKRAKPKAA